MFFHRAMTGRSDAFDPVLMMGTCGSLADAVEFVDIKERLGWFVICRPFPLRVETLTMKSGAEVTTSRVVTEWGFLLHRFF